MISLKSFITIVSREYVIWFVQERAIRGSRIPVNFASQDHSRSAITTCSVHGKTWFSKDVTSHLTWHGHDKLAETVQSFAALMFHRLACSPGWILGNPQYILSYSTCQPTSCSESEIPVIVSHTSRRNCLPIARGSNCFRRALNALEICDMAIDCSRFFKQLRLPFGTRPANAKTRSRGS